MCGEIEEWQEVKQVDVRLTTSGAQTTVQLPLLIERVEQIRLDESLFVGFNGGASAAVYLDFRSNGISSVSANNENRPGCMLQVDVLNPHAVYQRPKVLGNGSFMTTNSFEIAIRLPTGVPVLFTECALSLTFVCRKGENALSEVRRMKAAMLPPPSIKDGIAYNSFGN